MTIDNNWSDWIWDKTGALLKLVDIYNLAMMGTGLVAGALALKTIIFSMMGISVAAAASSIVPSVASMAGLSQISHATNVPVNVMTQAYQALINKLSAAGSKTVPTQEMMMSYLGDLATRAQGIDWMESVG